MNNEEPQFEGLDPTLANSFRGSVPENEPTGVSVFTVKAVDADADPPNNLVSYLPLFPNTPPPPLELSSMLSSHFNTFLRNKIHFILSVIIC